MPDIRGVAVADDVRGPFVLGGVGVAGSDVAGLHGLEVLERAQFVGHGDDVCSGSRRFGEGRRMGCQEDDGRLQFGLGSSGRVT